VVPLDGPLGCAKGGPTEGTGVVGTIDGESDGTSLGNFDGRTTTSTSTTATATTDGNSLGVSEGSRKRAGSVEAEKSVRLVAPGASVGLSRSCCLDAKLVDSSTREGAMLGVPPRPSGDVVGKSEGFSLGSRVGLAEGSSEGSDVGSADGSFVEGIWVGIVLGFVEGSEEGSDVGSAEGPFEGIADGVMVGSIVDGDSDVVGFDVLGWLLGISVG